MGVHGLIYVEPNPGKVALHGHCLDLTRRVFSPETRQLHAGAVNKEHDKKYHKSAEALPGLHSAYFSLDAKRTIEAGVKSVSAVILELIRGN